ncbi:MAG TPA: putative glycoside hydrolase [Roseiflexaceae bacterium]
MFIRTHLHRLPVVALALALAAILAACGGPSIALNGTITDAYTGKPVPSATIRLGGSEITTDTGGKYQFVQWSEKDTLQIAANGYEPVSVALAAQPQLAKPTPPAVSLDAKLRPNTLVGVVADSYTGIPLASAVVKAGETISATTGADGRYALAAVPESFVLTIAAPDHEPISQNLKRTTSLDATLRPNVLTGAITDSYTGKPLVGATVQAGDATTATGADGRYRLERVPEKATVKISADGYAALTQPLEKTTAIDAALRPDVLKGTLVDGATGAPIKNATVIATPSLNTADVAFIRIDHSSDGQFKLEGVPEQGYLQVIAPGYRKATVALEAGKVPTTIKLEPFAARALYITAATASNIDHVKSYFDTIDKTELNAIVIDLKSDLRDDLGLIYYDSQVPIVKELHTARDIMNLPAILAEAKKRGIYTIARIHIFSHDNVLAEAKPEWAGKDRKTGGVYAVYPGPGIHYDWLDPWNKNVWDYNIQLGVEAAQLGFDEINFDYIRFPDPDPSTDDAERLQLSKPADWKDNPDAMFNNIATFMEQSQRAINGAGAFFSVDVFGYAAWEPQKTIGQNIGLMSQHADYVCPMVYPSHYGLHELGFDNAAAHPYEIVLESLKRGAELVGTNRAMLRPWLQDFTLRWVPKDQIVDYGPGQVRAQIQATEDFGRAAGWQLWDSDNVYTEAALKPKK